GTKVGRGIAPAGASTGAHEARERRDADGRGVDDACAGFRSVVAPALIGLGFRAQAHLDTVLVELDDPPHRRPLCGHTLIATSLAALQLAAAASGDPLWLHLAGTNDLTMPLPEIQIVGGGAHAHGRVDLQDFMALPVGAPDWSTALDWCARVYAAMRELLADSGHLRG